MRQALRVPRAETRLTVYCSLSVLDQRQNVMYNVKIIYLIIFRFVTCVFIFILIIYPLRPSRPRFLLTIILSAMRIPPGRLSKISCWEKRIVCPKIVFTVKFVCKPTLYIQIRGIIFNRFAVIPVTFSYFLWLWWRSGVRVRKNWKKGSHK